MGIPATKVSKVRMTGPLAPFASAFRSKLKDLGYAPLTGSPSGPVVLQVAGYRPPTALAVDSSSIGCRGLKRQDLHSWKATRVIDYGRAAAGAWLQKGCRHLYHSVGLYLFCECRDI
jgi:hypothetical protein